MNNLNLQSLKADIALICTFLAGILGVFHLNLNVADAQHVAADLVDFLFMAVPAALQIFRELQHLKLSAPSAPSPEAPRAGA